MNLLLASRSTGVSNEEFQEFFLASQKRIPDALIRLLRFTNGALPDRQQCFIEHGLIPGMPSSIGLEYLLSLNEIKEALEILGPAFGANFIPFGADGDGNYLLVDDRERVYFWDSDGRIARSFSQSRYLLLLANSLEEFFSILGKAPDEEEE